MIKKYIAKRQRTTPTGTDLERDTPKSPDWTSILCSRDYHLSIFRTLPRKTFLNLRRCHRTWHDLPWRLIFERDVNPPMSTTSPDITQLKDEFWLLQLLNKQYCHNQPPLKDNKDYTACAQAYTILQQDPDSLSPEQEENLATLYSSLTTPTQPGLRMKAINSIQDDPIELDPLNTHIQKYINTKLGTKKTELFGKLEEKPKDNDAAKAAHTAGVTDMITKTGNPLLVFAKDEDGETPLHRATEEEYENIVELLIAQKAEVNNKTDYAWTPLHLAIENRNSAILNKLIDAGADVDAAITDGEHEGLAPLHFAIQEGGLEAVEAVIKAGADVNSIVTNGMFKEATPLHLAANKGCTNIAKYLINRGAKVMAIITNGYYRGQSSLDMARGKGPRIVMLLQEAEQQIGNNNTCIEGV